MSGEIYDRVAAQLYELVLRDPTPLDWATSPLESLSVLSQSAPVVVRTLVRSHAETGKEPELALEIADRTRRHRYLSSLPLGGRLLALRWVLEGPKELLNEQSLAQRQDLLTRFPRYAELDGDDEEDLRRTGGQAGRGRIGRSPPRAGQTAWPSWPRWARPKK